MPSVLRPRRAAAHLGDTYSNFNRKRALDPDYAVLKHGIPLGKRAIAFEIDDLDRVLLIKQCRRDGVPAHKITQEIEKRLFEQRVRERQIADAAIQLNGVQHASKRATAA
jgi:hypothetical protein